MCPCFGGFDFKSTVMRLWVCSYIPATTLDSWYESLKGFVQQSRLKKPYAMLFVTFG